MAAKASLLDPGSLRDFHPKKNLDNKRSMELGVCEPYIYIYIYMVFQSNSCFIDKKNES